MSAVTGCKLANLGWNDIETPEHFFPIFVSFLPYFWYPLNIENVICILEFRGLHEDIPASIATLAQRWPNVNPYVGPTSAHQRWANVDLSIGPTLAQRLHANVGPTLCQHRPNVGTLTLGQRWHNVMPMVVCQRCTNIGPTEAALLAFCEGNPSVTDRSPVEQTVELSNQWFETPMWSTSM